MSKLSQYLSVWIDSNFFDRTQNTIDFLNDVIWLQQKQIEAEKEAERRKLIRSLGRAVTKIKLRDPAELVPTLDKLCADYIQEILKLGLLPANTAAILGIDVSTLFRWRQRLKQKETDRGHRRPGRRVIGIM